MAFRVPVKCPWPPQTQAPGSGVGSGAPEWSAGLQLKAPEQAEQQQPAPVGGSWQPGDLLSGPCAGTKPAVRPEDKPDLWVRWFQAEAVMEGTQAELYKRKTNKQAFSLNQIDKKIRFCLLHRADPGLVLTASGTPVFVGVEAVKGRGDLGVPGVFGVRVAEMGDMGLELTSCPGSTLPGVFPPPSLLPDF